MVLNKTPLSAKLRVSKHYLFRYKIVYVSKYFLFLEILFPVILQFRQFVWPFFLNSCLALKNISFEVNVCPVQANIERPATRSVLTFPFYHMKTDK